MMLRKYLEGAILESIEQIDNDRVIHFHFTRRDELGDLQALVLIVELMGRHSTILLMNKTSGKSSIRSNTLVIQIRIVPYCQVLSMLHHQCNRRLILSQPLAPKFLKNYLLLIH